MVASMAAEMERDLIRERTLDGLAAAEAQGRKGGRPPALDPDTLAVALARRARGESVSAIAAHLKIGRSTLYRALQPDQTACWLMSTWRRPQRRRWTTTSPRPTSTPRPPPRSMRALACPTCGHVPVDAQSRWRQRQDLAITWLYPDPDSGSSSGCTARRVSRTCRPRAWCVSGAGTGRCWRASSPREWPRGFRRPSCGPGYSPVTHQGLAAQPAAAVPGRSPPLRRCLYVTRTSPVEIRLAWIDSAVSRRGAPERVRRLRARLPSRPSGSHLRPSPCRDRTTASSPRSRARPYQELLPCWPSHTPV